MAKMTSSCIEWGVASAAVGGDEVSGDLHVVLPYTNGVLVGVMDGLGHGAPAAEASQRVASILAQGAGQPLIPLIRTCHTQVLKTRGVVMSLAQFNSRDEALTWLGVGNVEGMFCHHERPGKSVPEPLLLSRGVVGARLPPLRATVLPLVRGDTLVFATDGIRSGFEENINWLDPPQKIAEGVLARDELGTDDSLVFVARYLGSGA